MAGAVLEVDRLRATLGPGRAVSLALSLDPGGVVHLGGPSGSGKTSMLRTIARLQAAAGGTMQLRGAKSATVPPALWRRAVAYVPQRPAMVPGTVEDNLQAGCRLAVAAGATFDRPRALALLDTLKVGQGCAGQDARSLSGGEAARVALIRALLTEPAVLLLDEVTAALDADAAAAVVACVGDYVARDGRGAIVVAHHPGVWEQLAHTTVALETGP